IGFAAIEREPLERDAAVLQKVHPLDVVPLDRRAVGRRKAEIALTSDHRISLLHLVARIAAASEGLRSEVQTDRRHVRRLDTERSHRSLRREEREWLDRLPHCAGCTVIGRTAGRRENSLDRKSTRLNSV